MNTHKTLQQTRAFASSSLVCVAFSLGSVNAIAAASDSSDTPAVPIWLQAAGASNPTSRDVSNAFHTKAPSSPAHQAATLPNSGPVIDRVIAVYPNEFRTIDGSKNTGANLGVAGGTDLRNTTVGYGDGKGTPAGADRKSAREISNIVCAQDGSIPNSVNVSSFVWNWGNIVDHDMILTRVASPAEPFNIPVPLCDPIFDPSCKGNKVLDFQRASATTDVNGIRQQINANTAYIDASFVYGADLTRSQVLRAFDGLGHLATSDGNLMPFNVTGLPNQPGVGNPADFFLGGDVRANENLALATMQTLFVREHNFWADTLHAQDPTLTDDDLYQRARAIVNAEEQLITYRDFIPILLGPNALTPYAGYIDTVDPRVSLAFSTAAFRVGHTFLPPVISRLNKKLVSIGDVALGQALFAPNLITATGIEPYLRGLARQIPQEVDGYIIDNVRNFQIGGTRVTGGFDLASLNMQRGRDNGLPSYNQVRIDYGLPPKATFNDVTSNTEFQTRLAAAYTSPDDADLWTVGICEDHFNGGLVGETFFTILKEQFQRSRDGDRFWYEGYLDATTLATVQAQTLSGIILRTCPLITRELQADVFHVPQ
jgi:peroxidase